MWRKLYFKISLLPLKCYLLYFYCKDTTIFWNYQIKMNLFLSLFFYISNKKSSSTYHKQKTKKFIFKKYVSFLYPFLRPYKRLFLVVWVTDCILCYCAHYSLKIALNVIGCDLCIVILFHNVIYLFCRIYFMVYLLFSFAVNFLY